MLVIREEQMEAFRRAAVRRFERDLLEALRVRRPAEFAHAGEPGVRQLIRDAIARAATYGVTAERDVATVAELDLKAGGPFEQKPEAAWARGVLKDETLSPAARVAVVAARLAPAAATA